MEGMKARKGVNWECALGGGSDLFACLGAVREQVVRLLHAAPGERGEQPEALADVCDRFLQIEREIMLLPAYSSRVGEYWRVE